MTSPIATLEENAGALKALGVSRIGLFGSVLRPRDFDAGSDVDVYVEFDPDRKTADNYFGLFDLLESLFGRRVDLVTDRSLSPYLGPKILASVRYASLVH